MLVTSVVCVYSYSHFLRTCIFISFRVSPSLRRPLPPNCLKVKVCCRAFATTLLEIYCRDLSSLIELLESLVWHQRISVFIIPPAHHPIVSTYLTNAPSFFPMLNNPSRLLNSDPSPLFLFSQILPACRSAAPPSSRVQYLKSSCISCVKNQM